MQRIGSEISYLRSAQIPTFPERYRRGTSDRSASGSGLVI